MSDESQAAEQEPRPPAAPASPGGMIATQPKRAELHAVIIRADGTREDLGMVAFYHRNPLVRWWCWLCHPRLRGGRGRFTRLPTRAQ